MYASSIPEFKYNIIDGYIVGQVVDGRASNLVEQAKGHFLNDKEMAHTSELDVIQKISNASYATQFEEVYGSGSLGNVSEAYKQVADAIAAFESTSKFSLFTSNFDYVMTGAATFTTAEQTGFNLFKTTGKGKCGECHKLEPANAPLFTNFTYFNIGTPINPNNPDSSIDIGLAGNANITTSAAAE